MKPTLDIPTPAALCCVLTRTAAVLALAFAPQLRAADGYAASVTGGAGGTAVTVTTEAQFRQYATATAAYIITVSGSITLASPNDYVQVKSNKTIKGANTSATIVGSILINTGSQNVIVQNLNITAPNPGRDGIQIFGGKKVFITKCSIYNCTDGEIDMTGGADEITISWCKFYYTADLGHNYPNLIGNSDTDTGTYRITIHHNWYGAFCKQRMPSVRFGNCHVYNNYFSCSGNSHCTLARNVGQVLAERNYYDGVANPCYKIENSKLRVNGNVYNNCTGNQFTTQDTVFTPSYSYTLDTAANVPAIVQAGAGNI